MHCIMCTNVFKVYKRKSMKRNIFIFLLFTSLISARRNVHRYSVDNMPSIQVYSSRDSRIYTLIDNCLRPVPLMRLFDEPHFMKHYWPTGLVHYKDGSGFVKSTVIDTLIEGLLDQINRKEKKYTHFDVLKKSGFVFHEQCGLLIVKFKEYPFVLKLFIETPKSFVNPYNKGFEASNFFIAGGAVRHTLGFTRIKTLHYLQQALSCDERWKNRVSFPRKWFWLPKNPAWLYIRLHNIGTADGTTVKMPAVYAVIADELYKDFDKSTDYNELMALSKSVEHRIDPHTKNFFIERGTGKIALIDTELFPMILGFNTRINSRDTHIKWYIHLAAKYLDEMALSTKQQRYRRQHDLYCYYL